MGDPVVVLAFSTWIILVALLICIAIVSARNIHCPICGTLAKKLFEYFKYETDPKEAREAAKEVLYCPNRLEHSNPDDYTLYCPRCGSWNLVGDFTDENWGFSCQTLHCGFFFSTII